MIEISPVETAAARREFIRCAERFHGAHPAWIPPLEMDVARALDPARGDFFRHGGKGALWLARREGEVVGRIGAFRNDAHLALQQDGAGFFGFFECRDDVEAARRLLQTAENWLMRAGLRVARGPANFNIQEEAGVLLDGFEHSPMVGMAWTPPYYRGLLEAAGYQKAKDLLVLRLARVSLRKDRMDAAADAAARVENVTVRTLDLKRLAAESRALELIFAEAWRDNWGTVPISAAEFYEAYERYRLFIVPELALIAEVGGEPAGAVVVMPDMNVLIREIKGRLWPLGWAKLLMGRKRIKRYRGMMMGVRPKFRRTGLPLIFAARVRAELIRRGAEELEFSWVLEENHEIQGLVARMGGRRVQTLRLYEKSLALNDSPAPPPAP